MGGCDALHLCYLVFLEADAGKEVDNGAGPAQGEASCTAQVGNSIDTSKMLQEALAWKGERVKTANATINEIKKAGSLVIMQETPQTVLDGAFEGSPATLWGILSSEAERTDVAENDVGLIEATQRHGIRGTRARVSCLVLAYNDV